MGENGNSWLVPEDSYLVFEGADGITLVRGSDDSLWFHKDGSDWRIDFGAGYELSHDPVTHEFTLTDLGSGLRSVYYDNTSSTPPLFRGKLSRLISAGGTIATVTRHASGRITEFRAEDGSQSVVYAYEYNGEAKLHKVTMSINGHFVRQAEYDYYGNEAHGNPGDLKGLSVYRRLDNNLGWAFLWKRYFRYYKPGENLGFVHGLKFAVGPEAWRAMAADGINPLTATDTALAGYADHYFEYDNQRRATKEVVGGGARTFTFAYTTSANSDGPNSWKFKTVQGMPDGSQIIVYSNHVFQVMLKIRKSGANEWYEANQYNGSYGRTLRASNEAVQGYNEGSPGLVTLKASQGLIEVTAWYGTTDNGTGAAKDRIHYQAVKQGGGGAEIKIRSYKYLTKTVGGKSVVVTTESTVFRSAAGGGSDPAVTSHAYLFHLDSLQVSKKTTTPPVVPVGENGSGATYQREEIYDSLGYNTWSKDELGFITRRIFKEGTGALLQQIDDVDTAQVSDEPSGWVTPADGGLHLISDYESDLMGRITQKLGPAHPVQVGGSSVLVRTAEYTLYKDSQNEVWTARGYADGTYPSYNYHTVGPLSVERRDLDGNVIDEITTVRAEAGRPSSADAMPPQGDWLSWKQYRYDEAGYRVWERAYFNIPGSGAGINGTNYGQTDYGYDSRGRRNRTRTPGGTISRQLYSYLGQVTEEWVGTNDTGATEADPTGGGASGNNLVKVTENEYGGNGLLSRITRPVSATVERVTEYAYDWRNRRTGEDGELNRYTLSGYDNLGRLVLKEERNGSAGGTLLAKEEKFYDARGDIYRRKRYAVNVSGVAGNALESNTWRDGKGQAIKATEEGKRAWTKMVYDGIGRPTKAYLSYPANGNDDGATNLVANDVVVEQNVVEYDNASNVIQSIRKQRFHDATGSGALNGPSGAQPKSRIYTQCLWPDTIGRPVATADYGTNGGAAVTRPATVPTGTDNILVSRTVYNAAGWVEEGIDPQGTRTRTEYNNLGKVTATVENYTGGAVTADSNKRTEFSYSLDGLLNMLVAKNSVTGDQVTRWEYGTTLADSGIASTTLLRAKIFPDSDDASNPLGNGGDGIYDRIEYSYDRQGGMVSLLDQNQTRHDYDYDLLGRVIHDRVAVLGSGVDGAVRRISMTYDALGRRAKVTSWNNSSVGSGTVVNEVEFTYDDFGNLKEDIQSVQGAVTGSTLKVGYAHANGTDNTTRLQTTTYPSGRVIGRGYGAADSTDDWLSRLATVSDVSNSFDVAGYTYIGADTTVESNYPQPAVKLTYLKQGSEPDGAAGDRYNGLDRFGRIVDRRWVHGTSDVERILYGYTRASLRQWRQNTVAVSGQDNYYLYDGLYQVSRNTPGTLNVGHTGVIESWSPYENWTYDPTGNWSEYYRQTSSSEGISQPRTQNMVNEITTINGSSLPVGYDKAGNMTKVPIGEQLTPGNYLLTWDAWNRLARVQRTSSGSSSSSSSSSSGGADLDVTYAYDGLFRRTRKYGTIGISAREYYWNNEWKCVEERSPGGTTPLYQYGYGGRGRNDLVFRDQGSDSRRRHYALCDNMSSKVAIVGVGGSGTIVERYRYSAFGKVTVLTPTFADRPVSLYSWTTLFHGEDVDLETGWYNYGYRYYLPALGRWPSRDPIGEEAFGSQLARLGHPITLIDDWSADHGGLYRFANNDGINFIDAYGLLACCSGSGECKIEKTHITSPTVRVHVKAYSLAFAAVDPVGGCTDCLDYIESFNERVCKAEAKTLELAENALAALGGARGIVVVYFGTYTRSVSSDKCVGAP